MTEIEKELEAKPQSDWDGDIIPHTLTLSRTNKSLRGYDICAQKPSLLTSGVPHYLSDDPWFYAREEAQCVVVESGSFTFRDEKLAQNSHLRTRTHAVPIFFENCASGMMFPR